MGRVNRDDLLEAVLKGLTKAQKNYLKWTKDKYAVSSGAEYVLTTYVAEQVSKLYDDYIFVEESLIDIVGDKKISKDDEKNCRINGRTDVALYKSLKSEEPKPKAIIELKNSVNRAGNGILDDINRIEVLIRHDIIEYGIMAFITEIENKHEFDSEKVEESMRDIITKIKEEVPELKYKYLMHMNSSEETEFDTYWGWGGCAILYYK